MLGRIMRYILHADGMALLNFAWAVGAELLLATRIWAIINATFGFLGSEIGRMSVAWVVAVAIGWWGTHLAIHGAKTRRISREYDRAHGRFEKRELTHYADGTSGHEHYNRPPTIASYYAQVGIVLAVEFFAIYYTGDTAGLHGILLLTYGMIFFALALSPFFTGNILHAIVNRPLYLFFEDANRHKVLLQLENTARAERAAARPQKEKERKHVEAAPSASPGTMLSAYGVDQPRIPTSAQSFGNARENRGNSPSVSLPGPSSSPNGRESSSR